MSVPLPLVRTVVFAATNVFALTVLALSAYTFTQTATYLGIYFTYSALGAATSILHLGSVSAIIIFGRIREGSIASRVSFQVGWLSYLCVMWLATGAQTAVTIRIIVHCNDSFCGATQAIAAFGFFNWLILFGYVVTLSMAVARAGQTGTNVWMTDVKDLRWIPGPISFEKNFVNSPNPGVATYPPGSNPNNGVPPVAPQLQPGYPQQNYPQPNNPQPNYPQPNHLQPNYPQPNYPQYGGGPPV